MPGTVAIEQTMTMRDRSLERMSAGPATPSMRERRWRARAAACACAIVINCLAPAAAQDKSSPGWQADIEVKKTTPPAAAPPKAAPKPAKSPPVNTTVIQRSGDAAAAGEAQVKLVAFLTADGQQIDQGVVWRIYQQAAEEAGKTKLIAENREASPAVRLQPGDYTINAAFGRANLTRKISVKAGASDTEQFVLNAGGLRVTASVGGKPVTASAVSYAIYSDDRDQLANRALIMGGAKPGLVIRLNAGIYRIVSTYGDANAKVEADVTVEAGKLTEAAITHQAAKAAFKLVAHAGGEALPDTHWTIQSKAGETVKESVGALPSHVFAPGNYQVIAKSGGRMFKREFALKDGDTVNVEVVGEPALEQAPAAEDVQLPATLDLKNP